MLTGATVLMFINQMTVWKLYCGNNEMNILIQLFCASLLGAGTVGVIWGALLLMDRNQKATR